MTVNSRVRFYEPSEDDGDAGEQLYLAEAD